MVQKLMSAVLVLISVGVICGETAHAAFSMAATPARVESAPREALVKMIEKAYAQGEKAAYVFDLDETLVDSAPRRYLSILDAFADVCEGDDPRFPRAEEDLHPDCVVREALTLEGLYRLRNRYDDVIYLRQAGAQDPEFIDAVLDQALSIYLSGRYIVEDDHLNRGAKSFVQELKRADAKVYFVSSRSRRYQGAETLEFLRRRGFIRAGEEDLLFLKEEDEVSVEFKYRSAEEIRDRVESRGGQVIGIFENEPENLDAWASIFPKAKAFFVEGAYLKNGPIPAKSILLEDFRMP
jgi:phosphoglycolate phosphatase-like HAD superfamily hydrolase